MRLLDLYCGAGGAAMGYHRAGFTEIVGVDVHPQPHYPFTFVQGDALQYVMEHGREFDAIHASPPCQFYSVTRVLHEGEYPDLLDMTREWLTDTNRPYVIENVVGAPFHSYIQLCGSTFGLGVRRHRRFESNVMMFGLPCIHEIQPLPLDVTGTGGPGGRHRKPRNLDEARDAMGIDWMTRAELAEAVPPAYTEFIGGHLLRAARLLTPPPGSAAEAT